MRRGVDAASGVVLPFVDEEGTLELNLAAEAAAIALALLIGFVAIAEGVGQEVGYHRAAERGPGVKREWSANDFFRHGAKHLPVHPLA